LFKDDAISKSQKNSIGTALLGLHGPNKVMVSNMWNAAKENQMDPNQDNNDNNTLMPAHQLPGMQANIATLNDQEILNTNFQQYHNENELTDLYESNKNRYEHELNKIRFVFHAARKLTELSNSIKGHPLEMSLVLTYLCIAKKGLTFLGFNRQSLIDRKNLFGVPDFENWMQSRQAQELRDQVENQNASYQRYWEYLIPVMNKYNWNQEDATKVLPQLHTNMDLNF